MKAEAYDSFCKECGNPVMQWMHELCEECSIEKVAVKKGQRKMRKCLKCDEEFFSTCFEHRLCDRCRRYLRDSNNIAESDFSYNYLDKRGGSI
tara:strand:- start:8945 stop:9223 length:279 start_codon:yes stop_codon:yes gene_type:complete